MQYLNPPYQQCSPLYIQNENETVKLAFETLKKINNKIVIYADDKYCFSMKKKTMNKMNYSYSLYSHNY